MPASPVPGFGSATSFLFGTARKLWVDVALLAALGGVLFGVTRLAAEWTGALRPVFEIDLSPRALPYYTFLSLSRGLAAYALSLLFTLAYGYWAARDRAAEKILIPALDILQSIPVLGFMPGLVLALVAVFPRSNLGLELASVLMIFTGQAWNMAFSFYHSLRSTPRDLQEVARLGRFGFWRRLRWVDVPAAAIGLVWNSMMSMAGGWFFLMVSEAFVLGDRSYQLPGLGSYMSVAVARGDRAATVSAVVAMVAMIVILDQILWRPVVVWSQRFRMDESGQAEEMESWFLDLLRGSRLLASLRQAAPAVLPRRQGAARARATLPGREARNTRVVRALAFGGFLALLVLLATTSLGLLRLFARVEARTWLEIVESASLTLGRVLLAVVGGTLWTVPVGLAIGLSPRMSRVLQPLVQVVASFPAPMLFPAVVALLASAGIGLGWGSVLLMLLGTQWYILFNVVAGATAIPADLREAARIYQVPLWMRMRTLYLPAIFPYLVTGWVTAAGGAWNASIVSEYVSFGGRELVADGLGSRISVAAAAGDMPTLAAAVAAMAVLVILFNRIVWRRLHGIAEERFALVR